MPDAAFVPAAGSSRAALLDRACGAYLGLAIGDALGATVEFMTPAQIRARHGVHRELIGGGWLQLPAGEVTDDTTMALALGDSLLQGEHDGRPHDTRLIAEAFRTWLAAGPVDCGATCRRGIDRYAREGTVEGPLREGDAGNGALMRMLPAALATVGNDAALVRVAVAQAHVTHHHPLSDAAVVAFGRMLQSLLCAPDAAAGLARCRALAEALVDAHPEFRYTPYPGRAGGYVVDTVQTVLHHFFADPAFEPCVVATVNQGGDADTTGAIAGMLAGALCGAERLPRRWVDGLDPATRQAIAQQAQALLGLAGAG